MCDLESGTISPHGWGNRVASARAAAEVNAVDCAMTQAGATIDNAVNVLGMSTGDKELDVILAKGEAALGHCAPSHFMTTVHLPTSCLPPYSNYLVYR
jgi:hypothetical protein